MSIKDIQLLNSRKQAIPGKHYFDDKGNEYIGLSDGTLKTFVRIPSKIGIGAGVLSLTLSALTFSNSNGISWGLGTNSVITGTVKTDYQTSGSYLTTAALSQDSSKYAGTNGAITGGSITVNTSGVSVNLPAYLTTAALSQDSSLYRFTSADSQLRFTSADSQLRFISADSQLAFSGFTTTTVAGVAVAGTHDSLGLKLAVPGYLTTAALSQDSSLYRYTSADSQLRFTSADSQLQFTSDNSNFRFTSADSQLRFTSADTQLRFTSADSQLRFTSADSQLRFTSADTQLRFTSADSQLRFTSADTQLRFTSADSQLRFTSADSQLQFTSVNSLSAGTGFTTASTIGSDIIGTLGTDGISMGIPKFLTTAALSQDSSLYQFTSQNSLSAGTGFTTATTVGINLVGTLATDGISMGVPVWLTTAALSQDSSLYRFTSQDSQLRFTSADSQLQFTSVNSLSAGTGFTTASTAGSDIAGTLGTDGLSMRIPKYLTTADLSQNSSNYAGVSSGTQTTTGSVVFMTHNTAGLNLGIPAFITTAAISNHSHGVSFTSGSTGFQTLSFTNSNGISFNSGTQGIFGSHNALTSQSTQFNAMTLEGNTAGTTTFNATNNNTIFLAGGNNITLSGNGSTVTISAFNQSVQTQSTMQLNGSSGSLTLVAGNLFSVSNNASTISLINLLSSSATALDITTVSGAGTLSSRFALADHQHRGLGQAQISGNTSNTSNIIYGSLVLAGGNSITLSQASAAGGATVTISAPQFSNSNNVTFGVNAGTITATVTVASTQGSINVSAGTTSNLLSAFTFSNGSNVSFGLNASTITASVATSLTNIRVSAGTASNNLSAITFSNLNGVSFGLDGSTITASVAAGGGDAIRGIAAGGSTQTTNTVNFSNSNNISFGFGAGGNSTVLTADVGLAASNSAGSFTFKTLNFSNANNVTFGTSAGGIITASVAAAGGANTLSFYENSPVLNNTTALVISNSTMHVQPFMLPYAISASFLRIPVSVAMTSTSWATSAASRTGGFTRQESHNLMVFTRNVGASSMSLASLSTTSGGFSWGLSYSIATNGTQMSSTYRVDFQQNGVITSTSFGVSESTNTYRLYTSVFSNFSAAQFWAIPFAISLSQGQYWLGHNIRTSTSTQGATSSNLQGLSIIRSIHFITQANSQYNVMGSTTNSSNQLQPGLGSWTTNSAGATTASLPLSQISTSASNPLLYFQLMRIA